MVMKQDILREFGKYTYVMIEYSEWIETSISWI
jgi:hypothetical protein